MRSLIIYDSAYGNTATIASAVNDTAKKFGDTKMVLASRFTLPDIDNVDIIFIGTPTQGGRPTAPIQEVISSLKKRDLKDIRIAPFDTRFAENTHGRGLKVVMKVIGFAGPKITNALRKVHGGIVENAEGFIVNDTEGPLQKNEVARATLWTRAVIGRGSRA